MGVVVLNGMSIEAVTAYFKELSQRLFEELRNAIESLSQGSRELNTGPPHDATFDAQLWPVSLNETPIPLACFVACVSVTPLTSSLIPFGYFRCLFSPVYLLLSVSFIA
jgi:hypothetical protein